MKIVSETSLALEETRGPTSRAHRVSRLSPSSLLISSRVMGPFSLKSMCNDMPRQRERERDNVTSFCRYRLLSTPEQRRGSARFSKGRKRYSPYLKRLRKTSHAHKRVGLCTDALKTPVRTHTRARAHTRKCFVFNEVILAKRKLEYKIER